MNLRMIDYNFMTVDEAETLIASMGTLDGFKKLFTRSPYNYKFSDSDNWKQFSINESKIEWEQFNDSDGYGVPVIHARIDSYFSPFIYTYLNKFGYRNMYYFYINNNNIITGVRCYYSDGEMHINGYNGTLIEFLIDHGCIKDDD